MTSLDQMASNARESSQRTNRMFAGVMLAVIATWAALAVSVWRFVQ